jgi:hypothetical protein
MLSAGASGPALALCVSRFAIVSSPAFSPFIVQFIVSSSLLSLFDGNTNCFSHYEPFSQMPTTLIHFWFYNLFTLLALSAALWVATQICCFASDWIWPLSFLFPVSSCHIFDLTSTCAPCLLCLSVSSHCTVTHWKCGPSQARTKTCG